MKNILKPKNKKQKGINNMELGKNKFKIRKEDTAIEESNGTYIMDFNDNHIVYKYSFN